jgi:hypothetical protein
MALRRRDFIRNGAAISGGVLLASPAGRALAAARSPGAGERPPLSASGHYAPNRAPLTPTPFLRLPPGAVTPSGWLADQLSLQRAGLNGRMTEISSFLDYSTTGWITPSQATGWEEVPYWLRGFGDLGYVTGDAATLATTRQWISGIMATAQSDGFFGPDYLRTNLNGGPDFWPYFPLLQALTSYQEYSGDPDVVPLLTNFFHYMATAPVSAFNTSWIDTRWATAYESIIWLYNRTGDSTLLDIMDTAHANAANWMNNIPTPHNVNISQGFTEPALYGIRAGDTSYQLASYQDYATVMDTYGQCCGGGFAADENYRPGFVDARQAFETCGIVELMQSHEVMTRVTGDPVWADRCENLAFNSLPAALDPLMTSLHYVTAPNSVRLDDVAKVLQQFDNDWPMLAYLSTGAIQPYHCCAHNHGQGWPYFVENLWLATSDNGLCAAMYAPSQVTARVADGTSVTIVETTTYPFDDTVTLRLTMPTALTFPLYLRVPGWCADATVTVNGTPVETPAGPAFGVLDRTWHDGDTVVVTLPMHPTVTTWQRDNDAASIGYGPLSMSLRVDEDWQHYQDSSTWPQYQVYPNSAWNYGLVLDADEPARSRRPRVAKRHDAPASPIFTPENVPISMTVAAQRVTAWQADAQGVVTTLRPSPTLGSGETEQVTLIPMGAARLRVTSFPTIAAAAASTWPADPVWFRIENQNSGKVLGVANMSTADSADVVQFDDNGTADHRWQLVFDAGGWVRIVNQNSMKVLGVSDMSLADSADVVQFDDNGTADHLWRLIDNGDGWVRIQNQNSGKVLGVANMSTADSAQVVQFDDNGTADHLWRFVPDGTVRVQNQNSAKLLAVAGASTADSADVVQATAADAAPEQTWQFVPDADGYFRIRNENSGKVLGVANMSTADSAQVVQFDDNGTADHLWRLRFTASDTAAAWWRVQNQNSGLVLGVSDMSLDAEADVVQFEDNGTADHLWQFL